MILLPFPPNSFVSLALSLSQHVRRVGPGVFFVNLQWPKVDQGCITNTTNWNLLQLPISNNDDGGGNLICTSSLWEPEIPEVKNTQKTRCNQALCFFYFSSPCLVGPPSDLIDWSFCKELSILLYVCSFLFCKRRRIVRWRRNKSCI